MLSVVLSPYPEALFCILCLQLRVVPSMSEEKYSPFLLIITYCNCSCWYLHVLFACFREVYEEGFKSGLKASVTNR